MAEEAASFNTEILSMSSGLILFKPFGSPNGISSTITKGALFPCKLPTPRILIFMLAPGSPPEFPTLNNKPGAEPCIACITLLTGLFSSTSLSITLIAPVRFPFFCVPYPTIIISSKLALSVSRLTLIVSFPSTLINLVKKPT